ncbi:adrenodoxin, mitochondrial [Trichonephila inaurata madagascariensis]|uniref:Adrenodoxin, mitochondrial n=1 Tax=Trichonephila inaurata madagascariensis TaxID=2747483 RepID=A0A8X6Y2M0_9ARAC|nr:adrenodoxin, mitochondrial [Trichonephila inaurata madagascariensis]
MALSLFKTFRAFSKINQTRFYADGKTKWVSIVFEKADGTQLKRKGKIGGTLQEVIGQNNPDFPGFGACDGTVSCSTCHMILPEDIFGKIKMITDEEQDVLDYAPERAPTSRLGCEVTIIPEMDGMIVKLPAVVRDIRES